jgi:hypothetical protein
VGLRADGATSTLEKSLNCIELEVFGLGNPGKMGIPKIVSP